MPRNVLVAGADHGIDLDRTMAGPRLPWRPASPITLFEAALKYPCQLELAGRLEKETSQDPDHAS